MTLALENVNLVVGGEPYLYDITMQLEPGEPYILLGPTTAGKTSLMRILAGLDRPTSGRVVVDGADVTGVSVRRRSVAMVYQQFINYPSFTVYENIASPLRRAGLASADVDRQVRETASMLRIDGLLDRLPSELSGGQQQRTALARALVKEASLLLLDEPLVNLDFKLREQLRTELGQIFERRAATVVYATTEPLEALMLGGRTIVMDAGRVLQSGSTPDVFKNPASVRVGEVFSDPPMNLIQGRVEGQAATLGETLRIPLTRHLSTLGEGRYTFGIRCGHLFVARGATDDVEIPGTVELAEINGSETFIHTSHNGIVWVAQEEGVHTFALGQDVTLHMNPRHLFAFREDGTLAAAPSHDVALMAAS